MKTCISIMDYGVGRIIKVYLIGEKNKEFLNAEDPQEWVEENIYTLYNINADEAYYMSLEDDIEEEEYIFKKKQKN